MEKRIRKTQGNLISAGIGVILFGFWSAIRSVMYYMGGNADLQQGSNDPTAVSSSSTGAMIANIFFIVIVTGLDLLLRVYIGRSAINEGKYGKHKSKYIFFALVLVAGYLFIIVMCVVVLVPGSPLHHYQASDLSLELFASILVDITSIYILLLMVISAFRLRKQRRDFMRGGV